jgi:acetyl/propionyl-CoA carboxylase alpha subunit
MFRKVLVADRGEPAVRILRACREIGCAAVTLYEPADICSLHVRLADECVVLEGPLGYHDAVQIACIARQTGADAIHPGYSRLAGSLELGRACRQSGVDLIGPSEETAALARQPAELLGIAARAGYPVLDWGAIRNTDDAYRMRQVAVQALGDGRRVVHLGERQRLASPDGPPFVAETPAPFMSAGEREDLLQAALGLARLFSLAGPGTVSFLVDDDRRFFFAGLTPGLDPEHPLAEMVTGVDIVREQIHLAAGEKLTLRQLRIRLKGAGLTCQISAYRPPCEPPSARPAGYTGRLDLAHLPAGIGVRVDSHVYSGYELPAAYTPEAARITAHGTDREAALLRMRRALDECQLRGILTDLWQLKALLCSPEFVEGSYRLDYRVDSFPEDDPPPGLEKAELAAIAALLYSQRKMHWLPESQEDYYRKRRKTEPPVHDDNLWFLRRKMR